MTEPAHAEGWSVANAKAHLSQLLDTAGREGPQTISKRGRPVAVVVSFEEWERKKKRKGSLADFLATAPVGDEDLEIGRIDISMRGVDL